MDILQAIIQLRPGTAWTQKADGTIHQVDDGTPRVILPTQDEINAVIASYIAPPTLEQRIAALETKI